MKVTVERLPGSLVRLEIAADGAEFDTAMEKAARKVAREVTVPGFRRGKAPAALVERMYGREVFIEEANRTLMDVLYRDALKQEEVVPVGDPEADITAIDPLAFTVIVPVYPSVTLGDYRAVRVEPVDAAVDPARIDEIIEQVRLQQSPWVDPPKARKAQEGDQVAVSIEINHDGEEFLPPTDNALFVIGESNLLDELKTVIIGLKPDETGQIDVSFDEDDERLAPEDPRRGKDINFVVKLTSIKERELLELDDEFAKTYGNSDSMEDLRQRISDNLHAEQTRDARQEVTSAIISQISDGSEIEVPAVMVDEAVTERVNRLRQQLTMSRSSLDAYLRQAGQTEEGFKEEIRESVAVEVRNSIVLREVASEEGIAVEDADIESEIDEMTTGLERQEETRKAYLEDAYLRTVVRNDLFDRRLTDRLIEIATEGRGGVLNAWTPPEGNEEEAIAATPDLEAAAPTTDADSQTTSDLNTSPEAEPAGTDATSIAMDGASECPESHSIKGNAESMLYHRPGDPSYSVTVPEFCFATVEAAEADGFRLADNAS